MTYKEFYAKYEKHFHETPQRKQLAFDGYELIFENGDIYRHIETIKPDATPSSYSGCYLSDDFTYQNTWNGEELGLLA